MQLLKKKTFWLPLALFSFLFASTAQAGFILLEEDFDDGTANGWVLEGGAQVDNEALLLGTSYLPADIATTAILDLKYMASVAISFDFAVIDDKFKSTRFVDLEFLSNGIWTLIGSLTLNVPNAGMRHTYQVDSGLGEFSQFRFIGRADSGGPHIAAIDNVTITAVSAPSITAIMFGALGLILFRRRRA